MHICFFPNMGDLCLFEGTEEETSEDTPKNTKCLQREHGPASTLIRSGFLFPLEMEQGGILWLSVLSLCSQFLFLR